MGNDHRFEDAYNDNNMERGIRNMCDVLDRVEKKEKQLQFECLKEDFPLI